MNVTAILQARVSSSRLPKKVLLPILGRPMLACQIERTLLAKNIDKLIIATSTEPSDNPIEELCRDLGVSCYRGSLEDVLDRFYQAAKRYPANHVVRITGDCPVIDPNVIDEVIQLHIDSHSDYTSNTNPPSYPDGLDVEVMTFEALETAWQESTLLSQREHVTPYIRQQASFKKSNLQNKIDLSAHRWTVDEQADFELITFIYQSLCQKNQFFDYHDIVRLLESNKNKQSKNSHIKRNEGYEKSLQKDNLNNKTGDE